MSFVQELKNKRDEKSLEFAKEFVGYIKPKLYESAEKGYSGTHLKIAQTRQKRKISCNYIQATYSSTI